MNKLSVTLEQLQTQIRILKREISALQLSADGSLLVATNNTYDENRQSQAWSVKGDPKKLDEYDGELLALSSEGTLMSKTKK